MWNCRTSDAWSLVGGCSAARMRRSARQSQNGYTSCIRRLTLSFRGADEHGVMVEREPLAVPGTPNEVWSIDFVMDALSNGRRLSASRLPTTSRRRRSISLWITACPDCTWPVYWSGQPPFVATALRSHDDRTPSNTMSTCCTILWRLVPLRERWRLRSILKIKSGRLLEGPIP